MSPQEQLELVKRHYALQSAGDHPAAEELLTDDFVITIPSSMPFEGVFPGKKAFRELIPLVAETWPSPTWSSSRRPSGTIAPSRPSSSRSLEMPRRFKSPR